VRVLITGTEGYIGVLLAPIVAGLGHEVVGLDTGYFRDARLEAEAPAAFTTIEKDLRHLSQADLEGFDVVIHLAEHERFERQGSNLYASLPITFAQAALGSDVFVGTIDGDEKIKIPNGTQTGTVFRLRGKGMPVLSGRGRGDLFVSVTLITPTSLTREQRRLLEQLAEVESKDLEDKGLVDKVRNIFS